MVLKGHPSNVDDLGPKAQLDPHVLADLDLASFFQVKRWPYIGGN